MKKTLPVFLKMSAVFAAVDLFLQLLNLAFYSPRLSQLEGTVSWYMLLIMVPFLMAKTVAVRQPFAGKGSFFLQGMLPLFCCFPLCLLVLSPLTIRAVALPVSPFFQLFLIALLQGIFQVLLPWLLTALWSRLLWHIPAPRHFVKTAESLGLLILLAAMLLFLLSAIPCAYLLSDPAFIPRRILDSLCFTLQGVVLLAVCWAAALIRLEPPQIS